MYEVMFMNDDENQGQRAILSMRVIYSEGMDYPEDIQEHSIENYQHFAKMIGFINSNYIDVRTQRLPRAARRRLKDSPVRDMTDSVQFVTLRRNKETPTRYEGETEGITYNWQWIVSGHYRNQWYPSDETHKIIWIPPYVKGPEDKPLKQRLYKVAR